MSKSRLAYVIDSHIHLYAADHLSKLNWTDALPRDHILNQRRSVEDYENESRKKTNLVGFIVVEADRKFGHDPGGWIGPLEEFKFLLQIARSQASKAGSDAGAQLPHILGIVPWAPLAAGTTALDQYVTHIQQICVSAEDFLWVKGFRYLLQDKPRGTMLTADFIAAIQRLGQLDLTFDLGVDARSGGVTQLQDACTMLQRVHEDGNSVTTVIDHFGKPNLHLTAEEALQQANDFVDWADYVRTMAGFPKTYMKLSGFFSELPPQSETTSLPMNVLTHRLHPWLDVVFEAFTPARIMFGSDWPVCAANGLGAQAWQQWHDLVANLLDDRGLTEDEKQQVWFGTAARAYNISL